MNDVKHFARVLVSLWLIIGLSSCWPSPRSYTAPSASSVLVVSRCVLTRATNERRCGLWLSSLKETQSAATLLLDRVLLETDKFVGAPRLSPDRTKILFEMQAEGGDEDNRDIFVIGVDGSGFQNITHDPGDDAQGDWSPDGKRIVFTSDRDGRARLYVADVRSGRIEKLFDKEECTGHFPAWLPDGHRVAFVSTWADTNGDGQVDRNDIPEIYTTPIQTCDPERLTFNTYSEIEPQWAPDRRHLAFLEMSREHLKMGFCRIHILDTQSGDEWQLYQRPVDYWTIHHLSWDPSGQRLVFSMGRTVYESQLFLARIEDGETMPVSAPVGGYTGVDW